MHCLLPSSMPCGPRSSKAGQRTSSWIVLSQVNLGCPTGVFQLAGGGSTATMRGWWSSSGAERARCPKFSHPEEPDSSLSETGKQPLMLRTVSFVVCLVYRTCETFSRHQASKASRSFASVLVVKLCLCLEN